ncbi:MAG: sulfatase [Planctomycetota bacterium]
MPRIFSTLVACLALGLLPARASAQDPRPDIVFVIVDDLNDWVGFLGGHPKAISPHLDALAESGMVFTQAYCNAPQCRPSRTSLNHGVYPFRTGTYFNVKGRDEASVETPTMQQFFAQNGYRVASGGKVFHGGPGRSGSALFARPADPKPPEGEDRFDAAGSPDDGYALDATDEEMGDHKVATWAIEQWQSESEEPLFMSVGFFRPHRPLQVPAPWFERFPLSEIERPAEPLAGDDWDDMPEFARMLARSHAHKRLRDGLSDHEHLLANDTLDATIRAYQASVAFVDRQIGRFIASLATNPRGRETVVMLVSDHGWHLGEKKHWCKAALWEQTTRIPFLVRGPGVKPGTRCSQPVSLVDVFPSLVDLAGLEKPAWLDGTSICAQLADPEAPRPPAICSYGAENTAVRDEHWRYIRYEDGSEELYDHRVDPDEWVNLALDPTHAPTKQRLAAHIPQDPHPGLRVGEWLVQRRD